ncbi:MAG TPA: GNAT family N-acetyltransferase [Terriglobia bacterium]|nr:GNAT family N-acetyltransferase [Terriglobia bacterium]
MSMAVERIDPLNDPRWAAFLERHSEATVFHTPPWLNALARTYGYKPVVYGHTREDEVTSGIVFCRVNSWLTGSRLVSLPFSDHCQPLVSRFGDLGEMLSAVQAARQAEEWKYIELRPMASNPFATEQTGFRGSESVYVHKLDLRPELDTIFQTLHKNHVQRVVRRAERQLSYEDGTSEALLAKFYQLQVLTRRRHRLPPQPLEWFRNLIRFMGGNLKIRVASKDGQAAASIITLFYKNSMVYKYGCSDPQFNSCGGMSLLMWNAIREAKALGASEFDFGRSDQDNPGLVAFKDHWGTSRLTLTYYRFPASNRNPDGLRRRVARYAFRRLPDFLLTTAGTLLYKHAG